MTDQPDRQVSFGEYHVSLWSGLFFSRITVRKDVWPALGGLISTKRVRRSREDAEFDEIVAQLKNILEKT